MGYQKLTPIVTTGATEPRYLGDRFADMPNVKDFGAKGDGETDDSASFDSAVQATTNPVNYEKHPIFIPTGPYNVRGGDGKFFSAEDIYSSKENAMASHPGIVLARPKDCGGDFRSDTTYGDDTRAWAAVHQGCFVDPYDNILYASNTNGEKKTRLVFEKWSSIESEREYVSCTDYEYDWVPHQSLSFYRPSKEHKLLICGTKYTYTSSSSEDKARSEIFNMWEFNYRSPSTHPLYKSFRIVSSGRYSSSTVQAVVSFDNKYLVAFYAISSSEKRVVVWKMSNIIGLESGTDISGSSYYFKTFTTTSTLGGQGIACDGTYIYLVSGDDSTGIDALSMDGEFQSDCIVRTKLDKPLDLFESYCNTTLNRVVAETESLFFARHGHKMCTFVNVCHKTYLTSGDSIYRRYNRFYCLSDYDGFALLSAAYEPYRLSSVTASPNANDLYKGGIALVFGSSTSNLPVNRNGYVQSLCYPVPDYNSRQIYWGVGTYVDDVYTRLVTKNHTAATAWRKFAMFNSDGSIDFGGTVNAGKAVDILSSERSPQTDSTSWSCILKMRNGFEASHANTYGFIGRFRDNENPGSDSTNGIQSIVGIGTVEGGNAGDGIFSFNIKQHNATVKSAGFYFTKTSVATLGQASRTFANVYVDTGPWAGSDLRLKDNIADPSEALIKAWGKVGFKVFQMKDALKKKGDDARIHIGFIAQDAQAALASEDLDADRYGFFGHDSWEAEYEEIEVIDSEEVLDEEGNVVTPAVKHTEKRLVQEAGDKYSIRYEEALVLECAYLRSCVSKMQEEIDVLKATVAQLMSQQNV